MASLGPSWGWEWLRRWEGLRGDFLHPLIPLSCVGGTRCEIASHAVCPGHVWCVLPILTAGLDNRVVQLSLPFPRLWVSPGGAEGQEPPPWISSTGPGGRRAAGAWPRPPRATATGGSGSASWPWRPSTSTRYREPGDTVQGHIHGILRWFEC